MAEFDTISKHLIQKYPNDFAGFTLPLSARISAIEDLQRLKQLHRAAIQVPNLAGFFVFSTIFLSEGTPDQRYRSNNSRLRGVTNPPEKK